MPICLLEVHLTLPRILSPQCLLLHFSPSSSPTSTSFQVPEAKQLLLYSTE